MSPVSVTADAPAPRVTVLMPVYNGAAFLRDAMESILGQTYSDFEFLIVDDGSVDATVNIILSYADPRIRLVRNAENIGQTRTLNRGLAEARGEFVARQDADDMSEPQRLAEQIAFLDAHTEIALAGSWYRKIDVDGSPLGKRRLPSDPASIRWALRFFCPIVHSAAIWRRELVASTVGVYDEHYASAQDYDYWLRIAERFHTANIPKSLVAYRIQPDSLTATYQGVTREFHAIAVSAMMLALGWSGTVADNEPRFTVMSSLLYGPWRECSAADVARGVDDVWALHEWFWRRFDLTREQRARQSRDINTRLRRALVRHSTRFLQRGHRRVALQTLSRALYTRSGHHGNRDTF